MKAKITSSRNIFTDGETCVTGSHRELLRRFRMHQMVARLSGCSGGWPGQNTIWRHLTLIGVTTDSLDSESVVEEVTSFPILCECDNLTVFRQSLMGKGYPDNVTIRG